MRSIRAVFQNDGGGIARCLDFPVTTQGETMEEAKANWLHLTAGQNKRRMPILGLPMARPSKRRIILREERIRGKTNLGII